VTPNAATPSQRATGMPQDAAGAERPSTLPQPALLKPSAKGPENFRVPAGVDLRKSAVSLFTFLRELVSLRSTVIRNVSSYDRVMWLDDVPKESESDTIEFRVGTASWTDPTLVNSDLFYPPSVRSAEERLRFLRRAIQHGRSRFDILRSASGT